MRRRWALIVVSLAASACANDWRTDMWYQHAVAPQIEPRVQPAHSVPLGAGPALPDRDTAEGWRNPIAATPASLARGQALFKERCAACHGEGHGGGPVSKFCPPAPDLAYTTVKVRSDGYLYGTITFGGRAMPPQADGLTAEDRWALVNWIRHLQGLAPGGAR